MSRANIEDIEQRIPFYLYVDEFQNFATDSFTSILSEARKYALILTVANQYIAQMTPGVKDAVFGNVGSIISFRTSADDAKTMIKYFEPHFSDYDLIHLHNRHFAINTTLDGEKVPAFSGTTLDLPISTTDFSAEIITNSRALYSYNRVDIEDTMHLRYDPKFVGKAVAEIVNTVLDEPAASPAAIPLTEQIPLNESTDLTPTKKRRRRRHHKRSAVASETTTTNPNTVQEFGEDNTINLR